MTDHSFAERRLREFEEHQARVTRFATHEEFNQFCSQHMVVFPQGMEYQIAQTCNNEHDLIRFLQTCAMQFDEVEAVYRPMERLADFCSVMGQEDDVEFVDTLEFDGVPVETQCHYKPRLLVDVYVADYNPYYDEQFEVTKSRALLYDTDQIVLREKMTAPCITMCSSVDSFDRMGSVKGDNITIIPLTIPCRATFV